MTNIQELQKLYGKDKEYLIGKDLPEAQRAKITISPLTSDDAKLLGEKENETTEEQITRSLLLISKSIGCTPEQAKSLSLKYLYELTEAIMDANGMLEMPEVQKKLDELKTKQK